MRRRCERRRGAAEEKAKIATVGRAGLRRPADVEKTPLFLPPPAGEGDRRGGGRGLTDVTKDARVEETEAAGAG